MRQVRWNQLTQRVRNCIGQCRKCIGAGVVSFLLLSQPNTASTEPMTPAMATMLSMMSAMANYISQLLINSPYAYPGSNPWAFAGATPWTSAYSYPAYSGLFANNGLYPGSSYGSWGYPGLSSQAWNPYGLPLNNWGIPSDSLFASPFGNGGFQHSPLVQSSPGNFWLNGQWQARSGEHLHIQDTNFRLISRQGLLPGLVTSNGDLLNLYMPQLNQTLLYQVRTEGGFMYLRDIRGNIVQFRKVGL